MRRSFLVILCLVLVFAAMWAYGNPRINPMRLTTPEQIQLHTAIMGLIPTVALTIAGIVEVSYSRTVQAGLLKSILYFAAYLIYGILSNPYAMRNMDNGFPIVVAMMLWQSMTIIGISIVLLVAANRRFELQERAFLPELFILMGLGVLFGGLLIHYAGWRINFLGSWNELQRAVQETGRQGAIFIVTALTMVGFVEMSWSKTVFRGWLKTALLFGFTFVSFAGFAYVRGGTSIDEALEIMLPQTGWVYAIGFGIVTFGAILMGMQKITAKMSPEERQVAGLTGLAILAGVAAGVAESNRRNAERSRRESLAANAQSSMYQQAKASSVSRYTSETSHDADDSEARAELLRQQYAEQRRQQEQVEAQIAREREKDEFQRQQRKDDEVSFYADKERRGE